MNFVASIPKTTVVVNIQKQALTTRDRSRLEAADAFYCVSTPGSWLFAQACHNPTCGGCWRIIISESDPDFRKAVERAISGGPCRECDPAPIGPALITYQPKSASAGGNGGGQGRGHRNKQSKSGDARVAKWMQRFAELERMIENGLDLTAAELKEYYRLEAKWRKVA